MQPTEEELGSSVACFPFVGLCIGCALFIVNFILSHIFPNAVVNIFLLLSLVIMSRGLHLDGFADVIDGFTGGYTKEERLKIMKDSSIGVFAVCGIFFLLLLKFIALNNLSADMKIAALFIMPMGGRLTIAFMCYLSQYISDKTGIARPFIDNAGEREFWIATAAGGISSIVFMGKHGVLIVIVLLTFSILFSRHAKNRIGGTTGDVLGAASEMGELMLLLLVLIFDSNIAQQLFDGIWL